MFYKSFLSKLGGGKHFRGCLGVLILGILLCLIGYQVLNMPRYLILPIHSPTNYLPHGDWEYIEYQTRIYTYGHSKFFIYRRVDTVSGSHLNSWSGVVEYYDKWLTDHGWVRVDKLLPCPYGLLEQDFLPEGEGGYLEYRLVGADTISLTEQMVCLAIWEVPSPTVPYFRVVLVTVQPSLLTKVLSSIK
jgi:hypothetical protein